MSTTTKNANAAQGTANANTNKKVETTNRPSIPGKEKEKNDGLVKTEPGTPEPAKSEPAKTEPAAPVAEAATVPATETTANAVEPQTTGHEQPKGEEVKEQPKPAVQYIKPALNLEQTVKYVEGLHRKNIQRLALISRIKNLEDFQINLQEDSDQLEPNYYSGCKLIIKDDKNREFATAVPGLIAKVAQFIYDACVEKLSEIESEIVFPN
jgi:hypothetical protein